MSPTDDEIMRHAGEWLLDLQEPDVSEERIAAWQRWMASGDRHARAFAELQRTSTFLDRHLSGRPRTELPWPGQREIEADGRTGGRTRWIALAAALALAAVGLTLWMNGDRDILLVETPVSGHRNIRLPDGSMVSVGAASRIRVAMRPDARTIELDRGEAYFDVVRDPHRPFSVRTGAASVTALGTAFNVRRAGERIEVGVAEGAVAVTSRGNTLLARAGIQQGSPARVDAGQRLVIEPEHPAAPMIEKVASATVGSWREGRLHYAGEPLSFVIEDVNRYADVPIVIADRSIEPLRVTGTVSEKNVSSWLKSLESALPIEVTSDGETLELRARR